MSNNLNFAETTTPITVVLSSATVTLDPDDLIVMVSVKVVSGTCTLQGSGLWRQAASNAQTLSAGDSVTIPAKGPNAPISGLVITAVGGTTNLLMSR